MPHEVHSSWCGCQRCSGPRHEHWPPRGHHLLTRRSFGFSTVFWLGALGGALTLLFF